MTKEELLEMVNATISGNGKQEITGKSLNLALTEIINTMGTGGGGLVVHFLPKLMPTQATFGDNYISFTIEDLLNDSTIYFPYREQLQKCIEDNIKVYNTVKESLTNKTPVPGNIYFDNTFFQRMFNDKGSNYGGCVTSWWADSYDDYIGFTESIRNDNSRTMLFPNGLMEFA